MDGKTRFSNRVDLYVKYRPGYPKEALDYLYREVGFAGSSVVADVGSGTGIFTRLLLERGTRVYAVEPNPDMRRAAEQALSGFSGFHSCDGSAEDTGLPGRSVDFVTSAQAFHWFDRHRAKSEFGRILKPGGKVVLIWNRRLADIDEFARGYVLLLKCFATDYEKVDHTNIGHAELSEFFKGGQCSKAVFANRQLFDFEQLRGRALSSSYVPLPGGDDRYEPFMAELRKLYERHQENGLVSFEYATELFFGEV